MNKISIIISGIVIFSFFLTACENKEDTIKPDNPLNGLTTAVFNPKKKYGTVVDIDGNEYKTIVIGSQTWMAENLRTTRYRNGDKIPNIKDNTQWSNLETGAYCNYNNTEDMDTIATFGRLYNWYAAGDERNIAPKGWRVPTVMDYNILFNYLGGDSIASNALKEVGNYHWQDPFESDNSSGFTALPGGRKDFNRDTKGIGYYGLWWTITQNSETKSCFFFLYYYDSLVWKNINYKKNGYAIRCIKE